jgi:hypothetical protein
MIINARDITERSSIFSGKHIMLDNKALCSDSITHKHVHGKFGEVYTIVHEEKILYRNNLQCQCPKKQRPFYLVITLAGQHE